jgi:2-polyprenyl-6-hydroxyphenyl methylase/3-demethylubiquinone-9 3-methyltransferase
MIELENIDLNEIEKFSSRAKNWWDLEGEFKTLHDINSVRLNFIIRNIKMRGLHVLDIGCGGGILTESIANQGAIITGIDASKESISVASKHANENNLEINYLVSNAEELSKNITNKFDVITCMELLEHVPNPLSIIEAADKMIKPGGHIIFSTINRNLKAYAFAILAGEYILNLIPKGTHQYEKFIKPSELINWCSQYKLKVNDLSAIKYNPILRTCSLRGTTDVNYILDVISDD